MLVARLRLHDYVMLSVFPPDGIGDSRVHLRFRVGGVRHRGLMRYGGELIDLLTVAVLAAGLRERLDDQRLVSRPPLGLRDSRCTSTASVARTGGGPVGLNRSRRPCV